MTVCIHGGMTTHKRTCVLESNHPHTHQVGPSCRFVNIAPAALRAQPQHPTTTLPTRRPISKTSFKLGVHDAPQSFALTATARPTQPASDTICVGAVASTKPRREASSHGGLRTLQGAPARSDGPVNCDRVVMDRVYPRGTRNHPRPSLKLLWGTG